LASEAERRELPVQMGVARTDAHDRHLTPGYLERISENGIKHNAIEPARRGRRRAHFDRPGLRLPIVVDAPPEQPPLGVDRPYRSAVPEASFIAKEEQRDKVRNRLVLPIKQLGHYEALIFPANRRLNTNAERPRFPEAELSSDVVSSPVCRTVYG